MGRGGGADLLGTWNRLALDSKILAEPSIFEGIVYTVIPAALPLSYTCRPVLSRLPRAYAPRLSTKSSAPLLPALPPSPENLLHVLAVGPESREKLACTDVTQQPSRHI